jgi:hypothetical protein
MKKFSQGGHVVYRLKAYEILFSPVCNTSSYYVKFRRKDNVKEICEIWKHNWDLAEKETFKTTALQPFDYLAVKKIYKEFSYYM